MTKTLPDRPSELIRLALADIAKAEADPLYKVNMGTWHTPVVDRHGETERLVACEVCFAGSVMAFSLDAAPEEDLSFASFGEKNERKLEALDNFRSGDVREGLRDLGIAHPDGITHVMDVGSYMQDDEHWKQRMGTMAELLERCGL